MKSYPRLVINLKKIEHNTRVVVELAAKYGMSITGVTKGVCGSPEIGKAMLRGGATSLADSRVENIKRLREAGIRSEILLLRPPMISEAEDVVRYADLSLNTELPTLRKLSGAALEQGKQHRVLLLVEMGERRDGINREELPGFIEEALTYEGITVDGIAMNLACLTGVIPTEDKVMEFDALVRELEEEFNMTFRLVSGGNSANIPLLLKGHPESRINNLRVGEAILLGRDAVERKRIPGAYTDAFKLEVEAVEVKTKPATPDGEVGENAFGEKPSFEDLGNVRRAVLALGRQDVAPSGLKSPDGVKVLWSSSDHIVAYRLPRSLKVGDTLEFIPNYESLLRAFTSPYVTKEFV